MRPFAKDIVEILKSGGIGVIPTDTIYGIVGKCELPDTVEKIYRARKRNPEKPCIILISSHDDLSRFNIHCTDTLTQKLHTYWPGKVSIIFPVLDPRFTYLTRGTNSLAFRMPDVAELRALISETGPLIAPSANSEGMPPAKTISEAKEYFGESIDFYVDNETMDSTPSKIIRFENETLTVIRE